MKGENIYAIESITNTEKELFELLVGHETIKVERIVSWGQTTPEGAWYDQSDDEWVILLMGEARIGYEDGTSVDLKAGDHLLIEAHVRHRVEMTSTNPPCIWLALHSSNPLRTF